MKKLVFMLALLFVTPAFGDYRAMIATEMAAATMEAVVEVKEKVPRSECKDCKGTGKIKAGDGVTIVWRECEHCYDDGKGGKGEALQPQMTALVISEDWCAPCQQMKNGPIKRLKAKGFKIDIKKHSEVGAKYGVKSLPTTIFFRDGVEVKRLTGYQSDKTLEANLTIQEPKEEKPKQTRLTATQLRAWCKTYRGQPYYVQGMSYKAHLMDRRATAHEGGPFQAWQLQGLTTAELMKIHGGQHTKKLTPWGVPP